MLMKLFNVFRKKGPMILHIDRSCQMARKKEICATWRFGICERKMKISLGNCSARLNRQQSVKYNAEV